MTATTKASSIWASSRSLSSSPGRRPCRTWSTTRAFPATATKSGSAQAIRCCDFALTRRLKPRWAPWAMSIAVRHRVPCGDDPPRSQRRLLGRAGSPAVRADQKAPEDGFRVCRDCGIVVPSGKSVEETGHRRSCQARRRHEKMRQEGKSGNPYQWENVYLYRQLRSEAIRLLLPIADDNDVGHADGLYPSGAAAAL